MQATVLPITSGPQKFPKIRVLKVNYFCLPIHLTMNGSSLYQKNIGAEFTHLYTPLLCQQIAVNRHNLGHPNGGMTPFFGDIFLAIVAGNLTSGMGDFDKLKNATNLLQSLDFFGLDFVTQALLGS